MRYLATTFAIAFMAFGFASTTVNPAQAAPSGNEENCNYWNGAEQQACLDRRRRREQRDLEGQWSEINEIDPLEQFADREDVVDDGEPGGEDSSDGDRAAASTAAE